MTNNTWVLEMIRDRDCRTDAERDVMNMAINSVKTEDADEFIPKSVIEGIKAEIEKPLKEERFFDTENAKAQAIALRWCMEIIDKHISRKEKE